MSRDGGATWEAVVDGARRELTLAGADEGRLFASDKHGLYESRDGGKTWAPIGDAEELRAHPWKSLNEQHPK